MKDRYKLLFQDKIQEILAEVSASARKRSEELYNSGAVDLEAYQPEEYWLPRIVMRVCLEEAAENIMPRHFLKGQALKDFRNLKHF